ncbi:MAG: 23S rRNA (pseudouridine(1915)-N(3))-methyltransferase RlmH, partial [Halanaerobiaceae bacterium]
MNISIIGVGKIRENYVEKGIDDFVERLKHYCDLELIEVSGEKVPKNPSGAQIEQVKEKEGKRIIEKIPGRDYVIALSVKGKPMTSEGLAKSLQNLQNRGISSISFLVGGALGLSEEVMEEADYTLSLSHMTFTHQMIRLILLEQIYRAFKIMKGEPYH